MCDNYDCSWEAWSAWSTTCGQNMNRKRYPIEKKETKQYIAKCPSDLNQKPCAKEPQSEQQSTKCKYCLSSYLRLKRDSRKKSF